MYANEGKHSPVTPRNDEPSSTKGGSWDCDGNDGGPSSLDVLISWLQVPGNYELWADPDSKLCAMRSLLNVFKESGITTRSKWSIQCKIRSLERQCATVLEWLEARRISIDDGINDDANSYIQSKLRSKCPCYRELAPMLQALQALNAYNPDKATKQAGLKRNAVDSNEYQNKRHQAARAEDNDVKSEPIDDAGAGHRMELESTGYQCCEVVTHVPKFNFSPDYEKKFMELQIEHQKKLSEDVLESNTKRRNGLAAQEIEFDKKRREALMEFEIQISKRKLELDLSMATATARSTLKKDGVATREINRFFPLPDK